MSIEHEENFPVASWLCPPRLRAPIEAIYHFARTADDIADEGTATSDQRYAQLQAYRLALEQVFNGAPLGPEQMRWSQVFERMRAVIKPFALPAQPLHDLLDAFVEDVGHRPYESMDGVMHYCQRSANPVGRLLLHLYGIEDAQSLQESDRICTALQLINFWQDFSVDHPRGRCYVPLDHLQRHGLDLQTWMQGADSAATRSAIRELVETTRAMMRQGQALALRVPGRAGWELRLVVQGGLRILEKIETMDYQSLHRRPRIGRHDIPVLLWRALSMGSGQSDQKVAA